ncbi:alpha/beta hydrolase [Exiguobacterium sp. SH5S4]|uniref:alpha/beta hydrolase n=1 Tax=Exiguobacterium sp. SH5S4 TaxID=2510961 RepID=UPI00103B70B9|nr:alpha/beta hydrolase [Exiguobacterium sp. SH5S4]TCI26302.1 alpha/beta hydrolase [Exiguobacterium sp. SH5S4]
MPVNPTIQFYLDQFKNQMSPTYEQMNPLELRRQEDEVLTRFQHKEHVHEVEDLDLSLPGRTLPIRIYRSGATTAPALVYYHGGGYVTGSIETHDAICRTLANEVDCTVISVGYRLAPEHKFPAPVEDAYDALVWIGEHASELNVDASRLAVGGDSAGGTLATVSALITSERGGPSLVHQLLFYPVTGTEENLPLSLIDYATGYLLDEGLIRWFQQQYFNDENELTHPYASPILSDRLEQLPATTLLTAEYDPLRDVGRAYANKLISLGVPVTYKNYGGLIHGFTNYYAFVPEAKRAVKEAAHCLKTAFENQKNILG